MDVTRFVDCHRRVVENCSRVIVGKNETISLVLTCLLCGGHVLLEDVRISAHSLDETLGNFEPGSQKSYNITNFSIYPEEVGSGVTLTFYWLENGVEQSCEHFVPIALATLSPELYAERTASSTAAPSGSTVICMWSRGLRPMFPSMVPSSCSTLPHTSAR